MIAETPPPLEPPAEVRPENQEQHNLSEDIFYVDLSENFNNERLLAQFSQELGLTLSHISENEEIDRDRLLIDDNYAASVLLRKVIDIYSGHDRLVTETTTEIVQELDETVTSPQLEEVEPVQNALNHPLFYRDTLGNPVFQIEVEAEVITEAIRAADQPIVNLSLEVGTVTGTLEVRREIELYHPYEIEGQTYYSRSQLDISSGAASSIGWRTDDGYQVRSFEQAREEGVLITEAEYLALGDSVTETQEVQNPGFKINEAYNPSRAREGLLQLFAIAENNPDKLIFAAAGNVDSFFHGTLTQLEQEGHLPPNNLVLVGVYFSADTTPTDGANFYVHRREQLSSSSEATAALSGVAAFLVRKGFAPDEVATFIQHELMETQVLTLSNGQELEVDVTRPFFLHRLEQLQIVGKTPEGLTAYFIPEAF